MYGIWGLLCFQSSLEKIKNISPMWSHDHYITRRYIRKGQPQKNTEHLSYLEGSWLFLLFWLNIEYHCELGGSLNSLGWSKASTIRWWYRGRRIHIKMYIVICNVLFLLSKGQDIQEYVNQDTCTTTRMSARLDPTLTETWWGSEHKWDKRVLNYKTHKLLIKWN